MRTMPRRRLARSAARAGYQHVMAKRDRSEPTGAAAVSDYDDFTVLLDGPADDPALGWPEYAAAFAGIVEHSPPQFAVGIFGDWGSGKTTLMKAIWRELESQPTVVQVWFNAWRYEREEHLIVPMLDTLREALVVWAKEKPGADGNRVRSAAEKIGRAARALLSGLSVRARVPLGIVEIEGAWDPESVMKAFEDRQAREDPSSFYHASFAAMRAAVSEFQEGGIERVVVYVDDLDRCLPVSALEVLESMKLFFDLDGFVFVVGLDQQVIERSVETKYRTTYPGRAVGNGQGTADESAPIDGSAYIKKIFQVSLGLPRITTGQIDEFFDKLIFGARLSPTQVANFDLHVRKHLSYLMGDAPVNPREVKRLLNSYTLQLKMLAARGVVPLDPDVVLALQTIGFRRDWQDVYERLTTQPDVAIGELRDAVQARAALDGGIGEISGELLDYLADAAPAFTDTQLGPYISSARSVGESDVTLLEAQSQVARMQRRLENLEPGEGILTTQSELRSGISHLLEVFQRRTDRATARDAVAIVNQLEASMRQLDPKTPPEQLDDWGGEAKQRLEAIDDALRVLRRQTSVRAVS
jgi:KAP family P-loop domain